MLCMHLFFVLVTFNHQASVARAVSSSSDGSDNDSSSDEEPAHAAVKAIELFSEIQFFFS
jgi:hypothetical protein